MSPISSHQLKVEILTALEKAGQPRHKINLIGREYQQGELELTRGAKFTADERALAFRMFEELKRDDLLRPTYNDLADPDNWVLITEAGRAFLKSGASAIADDIPVRRRGGVPKITLDANCIINLFDTGAATPTSLDELLELMRLGLSHAVEVAITTRVEEDLLEDRDPQRKAEMLRMLQAFPIVSFARPGQNNSELAKEIQRTVFPGLLETDRRFGNKRRDVEHLTAHAVNGRDVFVTDDTTLVKKTSDLQQQFGITVMSPKDCISFATSSARLPSRASAPTQLDPKYISTGLRGRVVFDYSNNNGSFTIGTGLASFETKWSKASDESIHAYKDGANINAVALAKGATAIGDVLDATSFDFSSRARTPSIGQVVIWRNENGLYAATQVVAIKDEGRGDDVDELVFDYVIKRDGSTDFSA